ncbi:hypothetical protein ACSQ76_07615 [Roseovarius sp. B08]|uniref:hypothetical protein n=1 Tax=Roseovarius sp. B08 TaxID=3449223 RepID=UPI003EDC72BC
MFIELIATVFAGIAAAGLLMLVNIALGRRLPRWLTPVAAGLGMIAATISSEYSWYDRTAAALPEGMKVAVTVDEQSWVRPWTQAWPYTERFVAVDTGNALRNENLPGQVMTDLYFFGRWSPVNKAPMLFDCTANRSALLIDGAEFAEDGTVSDASWQTRPEGDPILGIVCET